MSIVALMNAIEHDFYLARTSERTHVNEPVGRSVHHKSRHHQFEPSRAGPSGKISGESAREKHDDDDLKSQV